MQQNHLVLLRVLNQIFYILFSTWKNDAKTDFKNQMWNFYLYETVYFCLSVANSVFKIMQTNIQ